MFFTTGLAIVFGICYVAVDIAVNYGFAETLKLPQILLREYWKKDQLRNIAWFSLTDQPILVLALFGAMLFGYFGPLDKDEAEAWSQLFDSINY